MYFYYRLGIKALLWTRLKKHLFSLCCITPRSHTGVYRAILSTEKMDYAKPDTSLSQLEEKSDSLDKARLGTMCEAFRFMC